MNYSHANRCALAALDTFSRLRESGASDEKIAAELAEFISIASRSALLDAVGELILKAWWEARPASEVARSELVGYLVMIGKGREAMSVEDGQPLEPLGSLSAIISRVDSNLARAAEEMGLPPPPVPKRRP